MKGAISRIFLLKNYAVLTEVERFDSIEYMVLIRCIYLKLCVDMVDCLS